MSKILVISGHPNISGSNANKAILSELEKSDLDIEVRYLDKLYPNFADIDVSAEQERMLLADVIVLQFPLYWYSVPALLKHWIDSVCTFGFAFGPEGSKLEGKSFLISVTIGSPETSYIADEKRDKDKSLEAFLKPLTELSKYCSMKSLEPIYSFNMSYVPGIHRSAEEVLERAKKHSKKMIDILTS